MVSVASVLPMGLTLGISLILEMIIFMNYVLNHFKSIEFHGFLNTTKHTSKLPLLSFFRLSIMLCLSVCYKNP